MKVSVVCFDFTKENLRKQPWRYVHELITDSEQDIIPSVVTDSPSPEIEELCVRSIGQLHSIMGLSTRALDAIRRQQPDVVVTLLGPTSFYRPRLLTAHLDVPVVGIFGSPTYTPLEVANVGIQELYRHPEYLLPHALGSVVPRLVKRRKLDAFDHIITASRRTKRRLHLTGTDTNVSVIPTGINEYDLEQPDRSRVAQIRNELAPSGESIVLYYTSPLTLRGTDTLIRAFATVDELDATRLVFLSRQDNGGLQEEETYLKQLAGHSGIQDAFTLIPRNLSPEGIKAFLAAADIIALPYKLTVSTLPISILEAMAVGQPVVSTDVGGIPEVLSGADQVVPPNDPEALASSLDRLVSSEEHAQAVGQRNRRQMESHPRWDDARNKFNDILRGMRNAA